MRFSRLLVVTVLAGLLVSVLAPDLRSKDIGGEENQPLPLIESVPDWYLNPPVIPGKLCGVGISDGVGTLQNRIRQADRRAIEALSRNFKSSIQSIQKLIGRKIPRGRTRNLFKLLSLPQAR